MLAVGKGQDDVETSSGYSVWMGMTVAGIIMDGYKYASLQYVSNIIFKQ